MSSALALSLIELNSQLQSLLVSAFLQLSARKLKVLYCHFELLVLSFDEVDLDLVGLALQALFPPALLHPQHLALHRQDLLGDLLQLVGGVAQLASDLLVEDVVGGGVERRLVPTQLPLQGLDLLLFLLH